MGVTEATVARSMRVDDQTSILETAWGWTQVSDDLLTDLASFLNITKADAWEGLRRYRYGRMSVEWEQAAPKTAEDMRAFYGKTDAYVWSLSLYSASSNYDWYRNICRTMAELQNASPNKRLCALDYGSGVGETAILLASLGYQITIADVPGRTFEYAKHRLQRRGVAFRTVPVTEDLPHLEGPYDVVVAFDVLEHIAEPDRIYKHLLRNLRPGGLIADVSPFDQDEGNYAGVHLHENRRRFGDGRWNLFCSGQGLRSLDGVIRTPATGTSRLARRAHYAIWRATGLDVRYKRPR